MLTTSILQVLRLRACETCDGDGRLEGPSKLDGDSTVRLEPLH